MKLIRKINGVPTKEYAAWKAMKARCYAPCNRNMGTYQKNNIQVCERWLHSFDNFIEDIGYAPSKFHSLDRINNNLNYSKENCRWVKHITQVKNRGSFNIVITYQNKTMVLKDWAKYFNIKYTTLRHRIINLKLSLEEALLYKRIYIKKKQDIV